MSKQEQFLWIVQTTILANSVNVLSQPEQASKFRHVASATGVIYTMSEAVYASEKIPEKMSVEEAADVFCRYMLENLRDIKDARCPDWFARS